MNASNPYHFIKQDYIDTPKAGVASFESTFQENQHYSAKRRGVLEDFNTSSYMYRRNILNQWAPAEGLVYPVEEWMVTDRTPTNKGVVVIDPGMGSTVAGLLFEPTDYGWHVADEYYAEERFIGRLTDKAHLELMLGRWKTDLIVCDPAGANMRMLGIQAGIFTESADNNIPVGIHCVNNSLYQGRLTIGSRCRKLLGELAALVLDPLTDKPKKGYDHAADCLRYGARRLLPESYTYLAAWE